jgi:peptidyl-prolyl cis-trans isomerase SurA
MMSRFQFVRKLCYGFAVVCLLSSMNAGAQAAAQRDSVPQTPAAPKPAAPKMPAMQGQEIDRLVAIVNGDLILDSDVDEERRFENFQTIRDTEDGFSRDKAIERLINRDLILQQIKLRPDDPITDADVKTELDTLRKSIPACKNVCATEAGWQNFVEAQGFTLATLTERWRVRMEVLRFIEERFRSGARITDADIKSYYEKTMLPEYERQHTTPPKLETISDRIQEVLLQQQVSNLLGDWLKSLRAQGSVVVLKQGEVAP